MAIRLSPNTRRLMNRFKLNRCMVIISIILLICLLVYMLLPKATDSQEAVLGSKIPNRFKSGPSDHVDHVPTLTFDENNFYINKKKTHILSGSIHYFRTVPDYWLDRLKKLKAMGLNTVDT